MPQLRRDPQVFDLHRVEADEPRHDRVDLEHVRAEREHARAHSLPVERTVPLQTDDTVEDDEVGRTDARVLSQRIVEAELMVPLLVRLGQKALVILDR